MKKIGGFKKIKSLVSDKFKIDASKIIEKTKNKIGNYYINLKKNREKEQKKLEKIRKLDEKKNYKDKKNKHKRKDGSNKRRKTSNFRTTEINHF